MNIIGSAGGTYGGLHIGMQLTNTVSDNYGIVMLGKPNSAWSVTAAVPTNAYFARD